MYNEDLMYAIAKYVGASFGLLFCILLTLFAFYFFVILVINTVIEERKQRDYVDNLTANEREIIYGFKHCHRFTWSLKKLLKKREGE